MFWIELVLVLAAIFLGSRIGGAGLGTVAMIGLALLVFVFGLPPSSPPVTVLAIIIAVVTAAATMQAAGGLDLLVKIAERALRARPQWITFVAPIVAYIFTFCSGTGHVAYAILPVIAEVSRKAGIRPERPLSISVIASQQAITASPLAAATVGLLGILSTAGLEINGTPVELWHILAICIPSTLVGVMLGAIAVVRKGAALEKDLVYQERLAKGLVENTDETSSTGMDPATKRRAAWSIAIFMTAALLIVVFGMFPSLRPTYTETLASPNAIPMERIENAILTLRDPYSAHETVMRSEVADALERAKGEVEAAAETTRQVSIGMPTIIQILMLGAAGLMMVFLKAKPAETVRSSVAIAGVIAVISIIGLGWMGNCFFEGNREFVVGALGEVIQARPWVFAIGLFALSILLFSQASTVAALMPLGVALGLSAESLIAMFPAVNGYFFLPTYGTIVAAIAFDRTGTTRIGKFVFNHSFMLPGLVATTGAVLTGLLLSKVIF
ncbi:MAG: anaerobic C4-dicarboxylate transporter family protein [Phycisphaerales bacterium]